MTLNFRSIISFFFLALVLVMSSGLTVYSRSCDEGCDIAISFNEKDSCCEKNIEKNGCCQEEQHDHGEDDDCCDTEAFSLDADFYGTFHKVELNVLALEAPHFYSFDFGQVKQLEKHQFTDLPPPDLVETGQIIILKKNSYLI